ncbi:MAG: adenylosuccinate lyase [Planctomycetes bacterium]|nr:adenylosuccinate lyase [Planctomycetota bacterium]MCP4837841.1 adenylosuccinate lyase [Planctomycetota bacterium]
MQSLWSDTHRFGIWRRLWLALAESEQELGLDISDTQLAAMRSHLDDIDLDAARTYERKLRHDVMAHVHAWGDAIPEARGIIHLGATSQFVNCNTELILIRDAIEIVAAKTAGLILALCNFADTWKDLPTLGATHYQPAQPVTVGRRAASWAQDLWLGLEDLEHRLESLRFRGVRGATGSQASFMTLFDGDAEKVESLDQLVTERMGWPADRRFLVTGQTYPRVVDAQVLASLAAVAAAAHKCATDIRLLAGVRELEEPFEKNQIGSSAMAYKRNPMRCERACGMARFVMTLSASPLQTASVQWLERTLDDSSNRRLVLPEAFLALDGLLDVMRNVADGLIVRPAIVEARLRAELPFMATEDLMMAAVKRGADRQEAHEIVRQHAMAAAEALKEGAENDLLERLAGEACFSGIDLKGVLDPNRYVGTCPTQVSRFTAAARGTIVPRWSGRIPGASDPGI